ncbi:peptidase family M1 [Teladorsagia circumcincta]|uniref:Aminopeptidase n=1 Tax=Teladorsagia circumcincta TaxID=45464 RepID=A0A2G9V1I0_TELCI|nr:peptidase family M1 [Teladorsagia circumcincta]
MAESKANRVVLRLTPTSLFISIFAVAVAVALSIGLTYLFTRNAYDTSRRKLEPDHPGGSDDNSPSADELRLPTNLKPLLYNLTIKTYLPGYVPFPPEKNLTFDGQVEISMVVVEPTRSIILNAKNITVISGKCELFSGDHKLDIESVIEHERLEKLEFTLKKQLEKDQRILLKVIYNGLISDTLGGLYQATYSHTDGTTKIAAVSQMAPTDARRMVPCFDEPSFKANWTVTLIHPNGTRAISNGIETNGEGDIDGDWIISKFETTPRMSSYLLAVFVSEFEFIENYTSRGVRFSDMVAVPDFSFGAMENWGLITYRETALLYDERFYASVNKKRVASVVAHELSHQWFGDLVTMEWWDNLWLNEGFASFMQYIGANEISHDKFRMDDYFLLEAFTQGMEADAVASSHPLSFRVDKAADVVEAFDDVTYRKGASVLTMLKALIGEETFERAIRQYLKKFSYHNAEASDLWEVFDEVVKNVTGPDGSPMRITEFANQWTTQMGYPIVTVEAFNATSLKVTQSRYKTNKDAQELEKYRHPKYGLAPFQQILKAWIITIISPLLHWLSRLLLPTTQLLFRFKWDIPLWYQEGENSEVKRTWLTRDKPLFLHINSSDASVVVNADRHGFYRQNYDEKGWQKIIMQFKENHERHLLTNSSTRRFLIYWDTLRKKRFTLVLSFFYEREVLYVKMVQQELLPWNDIISGFYSILKYYGNEPESVFAKSYMLSILKPMYNKSSIEYIAVNYTDDSLFFEINLQKAVIDAYCYFGSKDCIQKYRELFVKEVEQKCKSDQKASECVDVAAPLRAMVYCYGVNRGGDDAFDKVMELYNAEIVQLEKDYLLRALGCHKDVTALKG